ncbi:Gfo/Idh/MocA family protein [Gryllotalpicola reticulitermitis]|uniref:Gfo/Idh/MocA family protein n=1 Tax=Gryllotalpicola reticulitermitis TaxID=1184153 RepID=A0ABV8Q3U3_9MICO
MNLPARVGVIGTGAVSHQYLPNLLNSPTLTVTAVADIDADAARRLADEYGVEAWTPEQLLASDEIDIVLNLTPIRFHASVTRSALEAGKHVYSEKSLATSVAEGQELLDLAESRGLVVAGAPDTLLGTSFQAARAALDNGIVGTPLTAAAVMLRFRHPRTVYFENYNALFDMAPYYVSALATLFGPIATVSGSVALDPAEPGDKHVALGFSSVLDFASGLSATLTMNWRSEHEHEIPVLDVYGSSGVLRFANPNNFGDPAFVRTHEQPEGTWAELPDSRQSSDHAFNLRGLGVSDLAAALAAGTPPRASGQLACHVVDVVSAVIRSSESGERVALTTTFDSPAPLSADDRNSYIESERSNA